MIITKSQYFHNLFYFLQTSTPNLTQQSDLNLFWINSNHYNKLSFTHKINPAAKHLKIIIILTN